MLLALTIDSYMPYPLIVLGSIKKEDFFEWFESKVIPRLPKNAIVIIDNTSIYYSTEFHALCAIYYIRVEYLLPYSPDYNPIEQSFNALKAWVRCYIDDYSIAFDNFGVFMRYAVESLSIEVDIEG